MQFNPQTKALFTDAGELVKILHCPLRMHWEELNPIADSPHRTCMECTHQVLDTATMTDAQLLAAVRSDPSTCFCVTADQPNLTITHRSLTEATKLD
jgi:hypothetical protein